MAPIENAMQSDDAAKILRLLRQPIYDTEVIPKEIGCECLTFFTRALGQSCANTFNGRTEYKDEALTNMMQSAMIEVPSFFELEGIRWRIVDQGVDANTLSRDAAFIFFIHLPEVSPGFKAPKRSSARPSFSYTSSIGTEDNIDGK